MLNKSSLQYNTALLLSVPTQIHTQSPSPLNYSIIRAFETCELSITKLSSVCQYHVIIISTLHYTVLYLHRIMYHLPTKFRTPYFCYAEHSSETNINRRIKPTGPYGCSASCNLANQMHFLWRTF